METLDKINETACKPPDSQKDHTKEAESNQGIIPDVSGAYNVDAHLCTCIYIYIYILNPENGSL